MENVGNCPSVYNRRATLSLLTVTTATDATASFLGRIYYEWPLSPHFLLR